VTDPTGEEVLAYFDTLSNWGRWGPDDEVGTLNLVTPEATAAGAALVREGLAISCSRRLDLDSNDAISHPHRYFSLHGEGLADEHRVPRFPSAPGAPAMELRTGVHRPDLSWRGADPP
jgi:hypothetical protein